MATYKHLRSSTANKRPTTSITDGQLAINTNTASPGLFFKDSAGTGIVKVGPVHVGTTAPNATPAAGGSSGNYTGEQWLDTSVSPAQMKVWNGSAWVGVVADELPVSKLQDGAARQLLQTDAAGTGVEWTSNVDVPGTLDVTSTATFDSIASHPLGSAGAPTITFTGDTNTGIYSPGADQVAVATNGTGRLFVDASGNVLVGTASSVVAGYKLQVNGSCGVTSTANASIEFGIRTPDATFNDAYLSFGTPTQNRAQIYCTGGAANTGSLVFNTYNAGAGAERLRITSAGLVGIGTSSPSALLHCDYTGTRVGSTIGHIATTAHGDASDYTLFKVSNFQGATESVKLFVQGDGKVGIGTTPNSDSRLHVKSGANDSNPVLRLEAATNNFLNFRQTGSVFDIHVTAGDPLSFTIGASERVRIDSSGRLLVGTSTARNAFFNGTFAPALQIEGTTYPTSMSSIVANGVVEPYLILGRTRAGSIGGTTVVNNGDTCGAVSFQGSDGTELVEAASIAALVDGTPGANDMPGRLVFSTTADGASSPTERMRLDSAGSMVLASGTAFVAPYVYNTTTATAANVNVDATGFLRRSTSSIKYKTNVETIQDQYADAILGCRPVWYQSTCEADKPDWGHWGFIAEEVAAIDPRLCFFKEEEDGTLEPEGVQYDRFVPHLLNLIKRQGEAIADLQAEVSALKGA
jgi:hypothetical protein